MSRIWKVGLLLTAVLLLMATFSAGQETKPTFSLKDRELIETYYTHLLGTLAPVVLIKKADLGIADILKNVAVKETPK